MKKVFAVVFAVFAFALSVTAEETTMEPTVSGVTARQNWPWNGNVEILYTLSTDDPCDMEVSATWRGQAEPVKLGCISGDIVNVSAGNRRIVWDPVEYGVELPLTGFRVTVTPVSIEARKYLSLNLVDGTVEYSATEPDWKNEPFKYLATNMVFRRISATTFNFGYPKSVQERGLINSRSLVRKATLSSDYYIAIFPTTKAQEKAINGNIGNVSETDTRDPTRTKYNLIRGSKADGNICWPETFHTVKVGSMVDRMRNTARVSLPSAWKIDLPTSAQWENAARARTDATQLCYLDGTGFDVSENDLVAIFEANANWKKGETLSNGSIGQFAPNPWGLYDTIGCMFEVVLDWCRPSGNSTTPTTDVTDPTGMATIETCSTRQAKGGRNNSGEDMNRLLPGNSGSGYNETYELGYRFCIHLKPITKIAD